MSDVNLTASGGTYQTGGVNKAPDESTMGTIQKAIEQLDSWEAAYQGVLVASPNADLPLLTPPQDLKNSDVPQTNQNQQPDIDQIINSSPDFKEVLNGMNNPSDKQMRDYIKNYITQKGGTANDSLVEEALAHFVSDQIALGKYSTTDGMNILNALRLKLIQQSNPNVDPFVSILKQQYLSQGYSEAEAEQKANEDALKDIDDYLAENDVNTPAFTGSAMVDEAIVDTLAPMMQGLDPSTAKEFIKGLLSSTTLFDMVSSFFNTASEVSPTPENTLNGTTGKDTANTALDSAQELIDSTLSLVDSLPLSQQDKLSMKEYLKAIGDMISTIKQLLTEIEIADAQKSKDLSASQIILAKARFDASMAQIEKQIEQLEKQKVTNLILQIVMPIVSALIMIGGLLLTPFTGGASLAATIAVTVALFVVFTALSQTGVLQKGFEKLTEAIKNGLPSDPAWARDLAVVATYLAIVIICVIVMVASRGSAGSAITSMVCGQVASTVLSSSDMIKTLVTSIAKAANPNATEESIAIAVAIITALVMFAFALGAAKCASSSSQGTAASEKVGQIMEKLNKMGKYLQGGGMLGSAAVSIYQGVTELQLKKLTTELGETEATVKFFTDMIKLLRQLLNSLQGGGQEIQEQAAQLTQLFESIVSGLSHTMTGLTQTGLKQAA